MSVPTPGPLPQALIALVAGTALFFILLVATIIAFNLNYSGRVFPGVSVAGVDLSGMRPEQAANRLAGSLTYPVTGNIVFKLNDKLWAVKPAELGLFFDARTSANVAFSTGRQGDIFRRFGEQYGAWQHGMELSPLLVFDQRAAYNYILGIAKEVDIPTVEASLSINGTDVVVRPGQVGRSVDIDLTLQPLETQMRDMSDGMLPILMQEMPPVILDASAQAEIARKILSAPLVLSIPESGNGGPGPWSFDQQSLANMLTIERVETEGSARYLVGLGVEQLRSFLEGIAPELSRQPENARFIFNDDTHQLEVIRPAVIGRSLNIDSSIEQVNQRLSQGEHNISLVFDITDPQVKDDATAESLGITELTSVQNSYFYGSSTSRIQNIQTAAERFHGVLVPPGATFSMADVLGDVSLDNGYAEALIIYGNRTIKGVGGGVCQVSTTLFRTAFFGGYPIVERNPHAYRVSYYELVRSGNVDSNLAGLDATVFVPVVDFKFTNDTPNWLLMETYVNVSNRVLTWKFYSSSDGRTVEWSTTGLKNIEEPPEPLYQENDKLARGEIRQVDWEADGADVTVFRTVRRDGQVYLDDVFSTHYLPWRAVYEYGPGTKIPKNNNNDDEE